MNLIRIILLFTAFSIFSISLIGQNFVFKFVNPSFMGGDSFNGSYLLSNAQSQSNFSDSRDNAYNRDLLEDFSSSLKRSILNQLSKQLIEDTFGENNMDEGLYEFGTFTVEIFNTAEGVNIRLFDIATGNETEILIPYF